MISKQTQHILGPAFCIRRLGEMALQLGLFQMAGKLGWPQPSESILVAPDNNVVNATLLEYLSDGLQIVAETPVKPGVVLKYYDMTIQPFPDGTTKHEDEAFRIASREIQERGEWPLLTLAADHREIAERALSDLYGVSGSFVTVHVRTPDYMGEAWNSHNRHRNADISTYLPAIDHILQAGLPVFQLGGPDQPKLPDQDGLIDYAHSENKSDWLDIYLMGAARFMLATSSGPMVVAHLFGVPIVLTNAWPAFAHPFGRKDLFLPKKYTWKNGEPLRNGDADMPQLRTYHGHEFDRLGVHVVDNTIWEIVEMVKRALVKWPMMKREKNG